MTFLLVNFAVKNATVFFPFLLSRTGLTISVSLLPVSDAVHCILHTHATFPASTCNHPCKYLRPPLHVLAGKDAII